MDTSSGNGDLSVSDTFFQQHEDHSLHHKQDIVEDKLLSRPRSARSISRPRLSRIHSMNRPPSASFSTQLPPLDDNDPKHKRKDSIGGSSTGSNEYVADCPSDTNSRNSRFYRSFSG